MSFLTGVWRLLGAEYDDVDSEQTVDYPVPGAALHDEPAENGIIELPEPDMTTVFVVRPELDKRGQPMFSLKTYAGHLLTRQALVLDIDLLAAADLESAMRVVDYLTGVVEAVEGAVWKISKNIFIFVPNNVRLAGDPLKPIEVF
jgi:hypothetical protein